MKQTILHISIITVFLGLFAISNSAQEKKPEPEALETKENAVAILNELIKKNELFSVKIAHHLLPAKIQLWKQKKILKIPATITWDLFKKDIHQFEVNLYALLEKDPKGVYYHIDALRKDHALYNLLKKLQTQTANLFSQDESGSALKIENVKNLVLLINTYATIFYHEKLLTLIINFFKKFELQTKKMRTSAEQAEKTAGALGTGYDELFEYDTDFEYTPSLEEDDFSSAIDTEEEDYSWFGELSDEFFSFD